MMFKGRISKLFKRMILNKGHTFFVCALDFEMQQKVLAIAFIKTENSKLNRKLKM